MDRITEAAHYAELAHRGQMRKWSNFDAPYITHPMRVAGMVMLHPDSDEDTVVAAWLHDVVEDTPASIADIRKAFGPKVADIVDWLTNPSKGMKALRAERKKIDREHLARAPWRPKLIKLYDRLDNLKEAINDPQTPQDFLKKYKQESRLLVDEALVGVDEKLEAELRRLTE